MCNFSLYFVSYIWDNHNQHIIISFSCSFIFVSCKTFLWYFAKKQKMWWECIMFETLLERIQWIFKKVELPRYWYFNSEYIQKNWKLALKHMSTAALFIIAKTQKSSNVHQWMNRKTHHETYIYNETLFSHEREWVADTWYNIDESPKQLSKKCQT